MPVLGHAVAGLGLGLCTRPVATGATSGRPAPIGPEFWLPVMVGLAYLPDIATQLLAFTGWSEARAASHSVFFTLLAAAALALPLARTFSVPTVRFFLVTFASVLLHDLLDLAQST